MASTAMIFLVSIFVVFSTQMFATGEILRVGPSQAFHNLGDALVYAKDFDEIVLDAVTYALVVRAKNKSIILLKVHEARPWASIILCNCFNQGVSTSYYFTCNTELTRPADHLQLFVRRQQRYYPRAQCRPDSQDTVNMHCLWPRPPNTRPDAQAPFIHWLAHHKLPPTLGNIQL